MVNFSEMKKNRLLAGAYAARHKKHLCWQVLYVVRQHKGSFPLTQSC
jgi:hypothetical protein